MKPGFANLVDPAEPPHALRRAVVAIGNFDGVHRGHAAVAAEVCALAAQLGAPAAAVTFEPHPADFFAGRQVVFRLTPAEEKIRQLRALGLDGVVTLGFDAALANLGAEQFVREVLVRRLDVGAVIVGADFQFGRNRLGSAEYLQDAGGRHGFAVKVVAKVKPKDELVPLSSSAIRTALESGALAGATAALGRFYTVEGEVRTGQQLGRTLGVPTANLALPPTNRLAFGVYAVHVYVDGRQYGGVASFGVRPSVDNGAPLLEAHLLHFSGDLYGRTIRVEFIAWLRGEAKFASLDALRAEMQRDIARAKALLAK